MSATTVERPKAAPKKVSTPDTAEIRKALVAAIREAVPGAKVEWNKTKRYQTFRLDGKAFGLVFAAGAKSVPVKIPQNLREIRVGASSGFKKSAYGLNRSLSKQGDVRVVAKVFAQAAAATKPAE